MRSRPLLSSQREQFKHLCQFAAVQAAYLAFFLKLHKSCALALLHGAIGRQTKPQRPHIYQNFTQRPLRIACPEAAKFEPNQQDYRFGEDHYSRLEPLFATQTLTIPLTKPWNSLAETVVVARDSPDASAANSRWWRRRELNPGPKEVNQPRLHA